MSVDASAQTPMERCELLGSYGEESGHLTRRFASSAMQQVNEIVKTWMRAAGMNVEQDNIGNLIARYEANRTKAKTFDFSAKRAGHDGVILSELTSIAMLFVRCRGGISHNPAEAATVEDVDVALKVLEQFILLLSAKNNLHA